MHPRSRLVVVTGLCVVTLGLTSPRVRRGEQTRGADVEWTHYAGNAGSQKYSPLDRIARDNIGRLRVAWRWTSPDNALVAEQPLLRPGMYHDTPLMVKGTLYTVTSLGQIAALDPATGQARWVFDPESWKSGRPGNLGFVHRGLAYWSDGTRERLLLGTGDAYLLSVDASTGRLDPAFGDRGRVDLMAGVAYATRAASYSVSAAPVVCRGVVVVGASIHDGPTHKEWPRGDVRGFDVRTGRQLWTLHAIPQAGEVGHDTWQGDAASYTGSTNVWTNMSADEALGYVYLPFGTATNDFYGGHRLGANLFAESLVAVDARTGRRVWHYQMVHHGVWDYDLPAAPSLVDLTVDGREVKAIAQVTKQGFTFVFDRRTGKPVWSIEERRVPQSAVAGERTSPTQPFPSRPPAFERQGLTDDDLVDFTPELRDRALDVLANYDRGPLYTPPSERGTVALPGWVGGANWGGAAVDPLTGRLYVPSITSPSVLQLLKPDPEASNFLFRRGGVTMPPTLDGLPIVKPPYSRVTAIDLTRGELRWTTPLGDGPRAHPLIRDLNLPPLGSGLRGSPLVTRTLLFVAMGQGSIGLGRAVTVGGRPPSRILPPEPPALVAFDKDTGEVVWSTVPSGRPVASPMTYLVNGVQYLVVATGLGPTAGLVAYSLAP
ncbi:MAG: pyrroloquinoline quinone-dependent dehydrogenase [Acidobacteriota bacterium]|nr:pyrroloquinoline quinone-dependent dehydrogenase [Acidobacteriota bacterium]